MKKGYTNTKFFHTMANSRKRNFFILCGTPSEIVVTQGDKHMIIYNHYLQHVGSYAPRGVSLNFSELGWEQCQLDHFDQPFSEDEIKNVIMSAPKEKALGPNGFIAIFFSS
jgi:hypothetical protein